MFYGMRRSDDGPVWSHDKMMGAAAGGGGTIFSSRPNSGQVGMWCSSDNRSRSRSPVGGYNY